MMKYILINIHITIFLLIARSDNPVMVWPIHKFVARDEAKTNSRRVVINDHSYLFYGKYPKNVKNKLRMFQILDTCLGVLFLSSWKK